MKKNYFTKMFVLLAFVLTCSFANAQSFEELFPLDGINFFKANDVGADEATNFVSYNADDEVITYSYEVESGWGYAGWNFTEEYGGSGSVDLSAYSSITIYFEGEFNMGGTLEFTIKYAGDEGEKKVSKGNEGATSMTIELSPDLKSEVQYIYLKSERTGKISIVKFSATAEGELELQFTDVDGVRGWNDGGDAPSDYNSDYEAFTFTGGGKWIAWAYGNPGRNYSEYDYVRIDFGYPAEFDVIIEVGYNPENGFSTSRIVAPKGSEFIAVPLNKEVPGEYTRLDNGETGGGIRDIIVRAQGIEGENWFLYVTRAFLAKGECPTIPTAPMADLVVTGLSWTPNVPAYGSSMSFSARVRNIGNAATENNKKHGCTFEIWDDAAQEYIVVTWSDNHYASIAPGEEVILTSVGNGSTGAAWFYGPEDEYLVRAHVNDDTNINESNTDNNHSEAIVIVPIKEGEFIPVGDYVGIDSLPVINGSVSVENGVLTVAGYPANASVAVYNVLGQKVQKGILQSGIHIVKIDVAGKMYIHKVLVK